MFTLTFDSVQEIDTLLAGLAELPAKHSYAMIVKVRTQIDPQLNKTMEQKTEVATTSE